MKHIEDNKRSEVAWRGRVECRKREIIKRGEAVCHKVLNRALGSGGKVFRLNKRHRLVNRQAT